MSDAISRFDAQKLVYDYCHARTVEGRQLKSPAVFTTHTGTDLAEAIGTLPAVQPVTVRLVFSNADATPKTTVLNVSAEAVPDIMAWYGAYCSGDRYTVTVDGRNVPMDQNGEPAHVNKTPKSEHDAANVLTPAAKGGDA